MVKIKEWDQALARLERFGRSGGVTKRAPQERINDEHARQMDALREAVNLLVRQARHAPDWARTFEVSYADADANGFVQITHDLGYTTTQWIVVSSTSTQGSGAPPSYWAGLRLFTVDSRIATFQLAAQALSGNQERIFQVAPMSSGLIPRGATEASDVQ